MEDQNFKRAMNLLVESMLDQFSIALQSGNIDKTWKIPTYWLPSVKVKFLDQLLDKHYLKVPPSTTFAEYLDGRRSIPMEVVVKNVADFVFEEGKELRHATA